jgi:hypothetical protein
LIPRGSLGVSGLVQFARTLLESSMLYNAMLSKPSLIGDVLISTNLHLALYGKCNLQHFAYVEKTFSEFSLGMVSDVLELSLFVNNTNAHCSVNVWLV